LFTIGKIPKEGKWVSHELSKLAVQNCLIICISLHSHHKKAVFILDIVIDDEKWMYYDSPKRKKLWINPGQSSTLTLKHNIHRSKVLSIVHMIQKAFMYYYY